MKLELEHITIELQSITGGPPLITRQLDISLLDDDGEFVDNVVIDKDDILWLIQEDPNET